MAGPLDFLKMPSTAGMEKPPTLRTPYPAVGSSPPVVLRAIEALRGFYPEDVKGTVVKDMPWDIPDAFSNTLARVPTATAKVYKALYLPPTQTASSGETIEVNPGVSMGFSQPEIEDILAHELQHVRSNRDKTPLEILKSYEDLRLPYKERPSEIEANKAANAYRAEKGPADYSVPHAGIILKSFKPLFEANQRKSK